MKNGMNLFSSYEGTVTTFREENNISKTQFYYHKRRIEADITESTHIFQSI